MLGDVFILSNSRLQPLSRLLHSLKAQTTKGIFQYQLNVVDNALPNSLRDQNIQLLCESLGVRYYPLHAGNIATARNFALSTSHADFLAFIDDDEEASREWLLHLVNTRQKYEADIVFGPNLPFFSTDVSNWAYASNAFINPNPATGEQAKMVKSTANCLLTRHAYKESGIQFDERFGTCGGSDTLFFNQLHSKGLKSVWCREAVTYEIYERERANFKWALHRWFRIGGAMAALLRESEPKKFRRIFCSSAYQAFRTPFVATFLLLAGSRRRTDLINCLLDNSKACGVLILAVFGYVWNEYGSLNGPRFIRPGSVRLSSK